VRSASFTNPFNSMSSLTVGGTYGFLLADALVPLDSMALYFTTYCIMFVNTWAMVAGRQMVMKVVGI